MIPLDDDRVGIDDRLADVLLEGNTGRLCVGSEVVERRPDLRVGACGRERVAPAAPGVPERRTAELRTPAASSPEPASSFPCASSQEANSSCSRTRTGARIVEWPRPQSSVQISVNRPVFVGVITISVVTPGTTSCFCPISGIQSEWITSADSISNWT